MMQTLPVRQLQKTPLESLWYLHKQPPAFDSLRAVIAQIYRRDDPKTLLRHVDAWLYRIWAVFFGAMAALIFIWLRRRVGTAWAFWAAVFWILHPSPICYATILDSTFVSSFGVLWFFYELWKMNKPDGSVVRLALACLFVFFTRTLFQWYFFPVLGFSLFLLDVSRKRILSFMLMVLIFAGGYIAKQYFVFGTTSTTTFAGYQACGLIWYEPTMTEILGLKTKIKAVYPEGAVIYANAKYNTKAKWEDDFVYLEIFRERLRRYPKECWEGIQKSVRQNWARYWRPSFEYVEAGRHALIERLGWRKFYEFIFSGLSLVVLLGGLGFAWFFRRFKAHGFPPKGLRSAAALLLPFAYIFSISLLCNIKEWGEVERVKFFLEPVFYVFIVAQIHDTVADFRKRRFLVK